MTGHFAGVKSLDFSKDGKYLITLANDTAQNKSEVKVWNYKKGKIIENYQDHTLIQDISAWDNYFLSVGKNIHLKYWSLEEDKQMILEDNVIGKIRKLDKDMATIQILKSKMAYHKRIDITIAQISNRSSDSTQRATLGTREIRRNGQVWEGSEITFGLNKGDVVKDINVSKDGKYLIICGGNLTTKEGFIQVFLANTNNRQKVQEINTKSIVNSVDLSPDGELLVSVTEKNDATGAGNGADAPDWASGWSMPVSN